MKELAPFELKDGNFIRYIDELHLTSPERERAAKARAEQILSASAPRLKSFRRKNNLSTAVKKNAKNKNTARQEVTKSSPQKIVSKAQSSSASHADKFFASNTLLHGAQNLNDISRQHQATLQELQQENMQERTEIFAANQQNTAHHIQNTAEQVINNNHIADSALAASRQSKELKRQQKILNSQHIGQKRPTKRAGANSTTQSQSNNSQQQLLKQEAKKRVLPLVIVSIFMLAFNILVPVDLIFTALCCIILIIAFLSNIFAVVKAVSSSKHS